MSKGILRPLTSDVSKLLVGVRWVVVSRDEVLVTASVSSTSRTTDPSAKENSSMFLGGGHNVGCSVPRSCPSRLAHHRFFLACGTVGVDCELA